MRRKALPETGELLKRGSGRGTDGRGTDGRGTNGCSTGRCDADGRGTEGAGFGEQREMRRIAVLDRIMNPTNVGAIVRSAAALGMDAVILSGGCADPLQRRAVRVSMGCIFQIPWTVVSDTGALLRELKESGYVTCAMALSEHAASIEDPALGATKKLAVVLGSEGDGLPDETVAACDYTVKIPMFHGADSLNAAAAAAIAFFVLGRGSGPLQPMQS
ncbi:MAG: RNA methyltransferase [Lachnospiraceae bacterium]|nr:RNA methyltransferase [Lachnospiraceae bacterium]